jgi:hypothetical protein
MIQIIVVNASKVLTDQQLRRYIPVMQSFDREILAPAWNLEPAEYMFDTWTSFKKQRPSGPIDTDDIWPIFINNKSDTAGALGWHDGEWQGRPIVFGRVFAGDCIRYGTDWRIDLTHEAWEMRGDPNINRQVKISNDSQGRERVAAVELCDPVEDDLYAIAWQKSKVSDFVLPAYFSDASGPWSHGNHLDGPCPALASGGYQSLYVGGQWVQSTARQANGKFPYRAMRNGRSFRRAGGAL